MKISFSPQQQFNSLHINYGSKDASGKAVNSNTLNKNGKKNDLLNALLKQKQNLLDSKNSLVDRTLKNGDSPSSIKDALKAIDDQIKEIDNQISRVKTEDQRKNVEKDAKSKQTKESKHSSSTNSSNTTNLEDSSIKMDNLLSMSSNLHNIKVFTAEKKSMVAQTAILNSQIKTDIGRGLNPIKKEKLISDMSERMYDLSSEIGNNLKVIGNEVHDNNSENKNILSPSEQKAEQDVQHYIDNLPENATQDASQVNVKA